MYLVCQVGGLLGRNLGLGQLSNNLLLLAVTQQAEEESTHAKHSRAALACLLRLVKIAQKVLVYVSNQGSTLFARLKLP